jgi:hypothetical protein
MLDKAASELLYLLTGAEHVCIRIRIEKHHIDST